MNIAVLYYSKTGFTQKYAEWIAQELACDCIDFKKNKKDLSAYDLIIYGGGIMASLINGYKKFKESYKGKYIVFAVGSSSENDEEAMNGIWQGNTISEEVPHFYFRGGTNFEKMGFMGRTMLKTIGKSLAKKENKTPMDIEMLRVFTRSTDFTSKEKVMPLIECVKSL